MLKMKTLTEERERFLGEAQLFPGFRSLKKTLLPTFPPTV